MLYASKTEKTKSKNQKKSGVSDYGSRRAGVAAGIIYSSQLKKQTKKLADKAKGNVEEINDGFEAKSKEIKESTKSTVEKLRDRLNDFYMKNKNVKNDFKKGFKKIKKAVGKTADDVGKE
jgi:hypothetical protein